jgi:signal transduction histidine kinase
MPAPVVLRQFRTRLSAAFLLVAAITSALLSVGSYFTIQEYRLRSFTRHADEAARLGMLSAPRDLSLANFEDLLGEFRTRAGVESVALVGDVAYSSSPEITAADIPTALPRPVERGELMHAHTTVGGIPYLVVAGAPVAGGSQLFFFFDRRDLLDSLRQFRNVLAIGWLVALATAYVIGRRVARRTLRPVARAADAAQALAEGLLQTRLPSTTDDEFGAWAQSFNRMAAALEDKIEALSAAAEREKRFTADVAHELRTPLTGMSSAASLLSEEMDSLPPAGRRSAELLIADVHRLQGLVLELLELARLDAGQDDVHLEALSLREAVGAVLRAEDGRSPVRTDIGADLTVMADRVRFRRVVTNLVANAAVHGGGEVEVVARPDGDFVALDVLDRGPGLVDGETELVFQRFHKADTARAQGGSGLGLAIALEHARAQGGSLEAANRDGGGARFTLRLPGL